MPEIIGEQLKRRDESTVLVIRFRPTFGDMLILRVLGFFWWIANCYNPPMQKTDRK